VRCRHGLHVHVMSFNEKSPLLSSESTCTSSCKSCQALSYIPRVKITVVADVNLHISSLHFPTTVLLQPHVVVAAAAPLMGMATVHSDFRSGCEASVSRENAWRFYACLHPFCPALRDFTCLKKSSSVVFQLWNFLLEAASMSPFSPQMQDIL
jgi:hypothetical protein